MMIKKSIRGKVCALLKASTDKAQMGLADIGTAVVGGAHEASEAKLN